jgi:hypothetical protein
MWKTMRPTVVHRARKKVRGMGKLMVAEARERQTADAARESVIVCPSLWRHRLVQVRTLVRRVLILAH